LKPYRALIELQSVCAKFNVNIIDALKLSDKYVTLSACAEIIQNDIEQKMHEYIIKK